MTKIKDYFITGVIVLAAANWLFGSDDPKDTTALQPARVAAPEVAQSAERVVTPPTQTVEKSKKPVVVAALPKKQTQPAKRIEPPKPTVSVTRYVDASRLNVRNGASKQSKVIWTLKRDQKVQVERTEGDWSYLKGNRFEGWVFSSYLSLKPAPKTVRKRVTPTVKKRKKVTGKSVASIKRLLIKRSHAYYPGNCPCPYNTDRAGRRCGKRSAYSRPGGRSPLCYNRDVTTAMIRNYRARN